MAKFYVVCDDDCRYEGMTREQILTAIEQAVEQGYVSDPDSAVFSQIKELREGASARLWIGTEAQFNELGLAPTIAKTVVRVGTDGVLYLCTDDTSLPDLPSPTLADSGKVMGVNDSGKFAFISPGVDFVVEQGVTQHDFNDSNYEGHTSAWIWRKWNSGIAECWIKHSKPVNFNNAWGSLYETTTFITVDYPFAFKEIPMEFASPGNPTLGSWIEATGGASQTETRSNMYQLIRPAKDTTINVQSINIYVIGRWK